MGYPNLLIRDVGVMMRKGIITFFVLALIVLYVIIYLVPSVTGMLDSTYVVEYGVLSIHDDTTGFLIRNETVYAAETSGMVNRIQEEGALVRRGTRVIDISAASAPVPGDRLREIKNSLDGLMYSSHGNLSQSGGIVSYFVDGFENKINTENALYYRKVDFEGVTQDKVVHLGTNAIEGYPVFKLVDNTNWYLIAYVPKQSEGNYVEGRKVDVILSKPKETTEEGTEEETEESDSEEENYGSVEMRIVSAEEEDGSIRLVLQSNRFFSGLGELRTANCRIVSASVRGLLVESASIIEEDGKPGVYVKTKTGRYEFVPINILGVNDKTTVVSDMYFYDEEGVWTSTIGPFDDILKDPSKRDKDADAEETEAEETEEPAAEETDEPTAEETEEPAEEVTEDPAAEETEETEETDTEEGD